jgi:hypothetical protein
MLALLSKEKTWVALNYYSQSHVNLDVMGKQCTVMIFTVGVQNFLSSTMLSKRVRQVSNVC